MREKGLILASAAAVLILALAMTYQFIHQKFVDQSAQIDALEGKRKEVIENLAKYTTLNARRQIIESEYTKAEIKEGVRSHLEKLLREKAGVTTGSYTIRDKPTSEFGGSYELAPFSVTFPAVTLQGVVDFLREVTHGPRPLVLTELEMKKGRMGERMDVSADVSSIRKVN